MFDPKIVSRPSTGNSKNLFSRFLKQLEPHCMDIKSLPLGIHMKGYIWVPSSQYRII